MPEVSVIIPSYNHAVFLRECIDSILNQTFQDFEIILIDDGSSDDSVELAQQIAKTEPRLTVLTNEQNLGTYGTQARGLELAKSPFVAIMNSDDLWAPEKLEKQLNLLKQHPETPLCYVLGWMVDETGQANKSDDVHADWPTSELQEVLPYLLYENRILASGVLWRKECVRFETTCRYSGDWLALLEAAIKSPVLCVNERLNFWRQHDNNSYHLSAKQAIEEVRVREAIKAQWMEWDLKRLDQAQVQRGIAQNLMNLGTMYAYFYDIKQTRKSLLASLKISPNPKQVFKRYLGSLLPIERFRKHVVPASQPEDTPKSYKEMLSDVTTLRIHS